MGADPHLKHCIIKDCENVGLYVTDHAQVSRTFDIYLSQTFFCFLQYCHLLLIFNSILIFVPDSIILLFKNSNCTVVKLYRTVILIYCLLGVNKLDGAVS